MVEDNLEDKIGTILVVDDEYDARELVSDPIQLYFQGKYDVVEAANGKDALEKVRDIDYLAGVVTDGNMPVMDGFELIEKLREVYKDIPIIMQRGSSTAHYDAGAAFRKGADGYVDKNDIGQNILLIAKSLDEINNTGTSESLTSYMKQKGFLRRKVMYIESDKSLRETAKENIEMNNPDASVDTYPSFEEAKGAIDKKTGYDLILTYRGEDDHLREDFKGGLVFDENSDGYLFLKELSEDLKTPVIMFSSLARNEHVDKYIRPLVTELYDVDEMGDVLSSVVDRHIAKP